MSSHDREAWERLGEMLVRRRLELDPRYRNRRTFTREHAPDLYRIVNDIELGRRDNYEPATLAAIEAAYSLPAGTIGRLLDGQLATSDGPSAAPERTPRTRVIPALRRTPALEPYAAVVELEHKAQIPPRAGEQDVWDSDAFGDEEKVNFIAMMRLLNDTSARETSTGLYPRIRGFWSQQGHDAANWHVAADSLTR